MVGCEDCVRQFTIGSNWKFRPEEVFAAIDHCLQGIHPALDGTEANLDVNFNRLF
jgi:hypothetical protein